MNLTNSPCFEEITNSIFSDSKITCGHYQESTDNDNFFRFVYCIEITPDLFDLFFNSINGYRAWYYRSPAEGIKKNSSFIQSILPKLLASDKLLSFDKDLIIKSLLSKSSKVWLAEKSLALCSECGEWSFSKLVEPEIFNNKWEVNTDANSKYGMTAPFMKKLRIIGAFIKQINDEYIPNRKIDRADQISNTGWS